MDYIRENKVKAVCLNQPEAGVLVDKNSLMTIKEAANYLRINPEEKLICLSENSIEWLDNVHPDRELINQITTLKDKYKFRQSMEPWFKTFYFDNFHNKALIDGSWSPPNRFPIIVKPRSGFFSLGVQRINCMEDWANYRDYLILNESAKNEFPESVLNKHESIVEDLISGNEIACDCYFDDSGKPIILSLFQHDFESDTDMSDRLYRVSEKIITKYYDDVFKVLQSVSIAFMLKSFPVHVEMRLHPEFGLQIIEVNPLRFGGWCTTADVSEYAFNFNLYDAYFKNVKPAKEDLLDLIGNREVALIILDKRGRAKSNSVTYFDYKKMVSEEA